MAILFRSQWVKDNLVNVILTINLILSIFTIMYTVVNLSGRYTVTQGIWNCWSIWRIYSLWDGHNLCSKKCDRNCQDHTYRVWVLQSISNNRGCWVLLEHHCNGNTTRHISFIGYGTHHWCQNNSYQVIHRVDIDAFTSRTYKIKTQLERFCRQNRTSLNGILLMNERHKIRRMNLHSYIHCDRHVGIGCTL